MSYIQNNRREEVIIKTANASCNTNQGIIEGTLVLTNIRIYLKIDNENKINEVLLKDIVKVSIGGLHVLRLELQNNQSTNFLVNHVFKWQKETKKAVKNY